MAHTLAPAEIEWNALLTSLHQRKCILLLGPQLMPGHRVFDDLCAWLDAPDNPAGLRPNDFRATVRYAHSLSRCGLDAAR